jgi:hypothetical protein
LAIEERSLPLDALQPGMFVCRIDRPWGETPFPLQGLMITSRADIDSLRPFTLQAVVDFRRSVLPQGRSLLLTLGYRPTAGARLPELRPYPDALPVEHELPRARSAHRSALGLAQRLQEDLRAGRPLELDQLSEAVEPMVASVLRSPDAFFWLMALRQRDPDRSVCRRSCWWKSRARRCSWTSACRCCPTACAITVCCCRRWSAGRCSATSSWACKPCASARG